MHTITSGVHRLPALLPDAINAFLVEDVLLDAGARPSTRRILRALQRTPLSAHVLTHAHADHQGASHAVCVAHEVPLWCGAADAAAVESGDLTGGLPANVVTRLQQRMWAGPAHPVARALREGDVVAGFIVLETPGHSPGHIALWREHDRVLIAGDTMNGMHLLTTRRGVREPPTLFTPDPLLNRESIRRLAALDPLVTVFGHGPECRNPDELHALVAAFDAAKPSAAGPSPHQLASSR